MANDKYHPDSFVTHGRHNLRHIEHPCAIFHVVFRLVDSIPETLLQQWKEDVGFFNESHGVNTRSVFSQGKHRILQLKNDKLSQYEDSLHGECLLQYPQNAKIVQDCILFGDGTRYRLHRWCIMPNHVHVIIETIQSSNTTIAKIVQNWKSFSARQINQTMERQGQLWMNDYFSRLIQSDEEYVFQMAYVLNNPQNAGLENWAWQGDGSGSHAVRE